MVVVFKHRNAIEITNEGVVFLASLPPHSGYSCSQMFCGKSYNVSGIIIITTPESREILFEGKSLATHKTLNND